MRVSAAVEIFLKDRRSRGCGVCAQAQYLQVCNLFLAWLESIGISDLGDVDVLVVGRYIEHLRIRPQLGSRLGVLSPVTVQVHVRGLRTFFVWAHRSGFLADAGLLLIRAPRVSRRLPKTLSPGDVGRLLSSLMTVRDRALIFLLVYSGLRIAEVAALQVSDLDLNRCMVHVRHGKGDKERWSMFSDSALVVLQDWLREREKVATSGYESVAPSGFLFLDQFGCALKPGGLYKVVRRVGRSIGVDVAPHRLRHTFATEFLNAGGRIEDLQLLMGHEQLSTTMQYVSVALDRVRERYRKLALFG